jgi:1-deoxy-D-xylulose-5-phosphate synthase
LPVGQAEVVCEGEEFVILGLGSLLPLAKELAEALDRQGSSAAVINPRFIKPLDRELIGRYARHATAVVTFEDHVLMGGFGSAVLEALNQMDIETPVIRIGWPDQFIEHGKVDALRAKYGISVEAALERLTPYLRRRAKLLAR